MWLYKAGITSSARYHHFTLWNKRYFKWNKHTKEVKEVIEKNWRIRHTHKKPQVVISSLIKRYDQDFNEDIKSINEKIWSLCTSKGLHFINNSNIDKSCLNRSKLHLNRKGSPFLANNFKKFVNFLWKSNPLAEISHGTHEHPMNSLAELKFLRIRNHNNVIFSCLKIISIKNKFDNLKLLIDEHVDILCVVETKIDSSFPTSQFSWSGYHKPYRLDI